MDTIQKMMCVKNVQIDIQSAKVKIKGQSVKGSIEILTIKKLVNAKEGFMMMELILIVKDVLILVLSVISLVVLKMFVKSLNNMIYDFKVLLNKYFYYIYQVNFV